VRGVTARRVAILARTCPGCGTIGISWNGTLVARVSLAAPTARLRQVLARLVLPGGAAGTLRITVLSSGKPVLIDGVGLSAV